MVLPNKVASSLTAALEKQVAKMKEEVGAQKVEAGMTCVRNNCNVKYVYTQSHCKPDSAVPSLGPATLPNRIAGAKHR